ncbi:hypothetical protein, partial [Bacteroides uniformis]|uniref:hypothetical protein n=1 Tax=Bacteroides uniformis TaxID=820 RepID=UPI0039B67B4F
ILLKTVKGFCCLMQEIKNGIDRTHLMLSVPDKPPDKPLLPYIELRTGYYLQKGRPHIRKQNGLCTQRDIS